MSALPPAKVLHLLSAAAAASASARSLLPLRREREREACASSNLHSRPVRRLINTLNTHFQSAGRHEITWQQQLENQPFAAVSLCLPLYPALVRAVIR